MIMAVAVLNIYVEKKQLFVNHILLALHIGRILHSIMKICNTNIVYIKAVNIIFHAEKLILPSRILVARYEFSNTAFWFL